MQVSPLQVHQEAQEDEKPLWTGTILDIFRWGRFRMFRSSCPAVQISILPQSPANKSEVPLPADTEESQLIRNKSDPLALLVNKKPGLVRRFTWKEMKSKDYEDRVYEEFIQIERLILRLCGAYGLYQGKHGTRGGMFRRLEGRHTMVLLFELCFVTHGASKCIINWNTPNGFWSMILPLLVIFTALVFHIFEIISDFCPNWQKIVAPFCRGEEEIDYLKRLHSLREWRLQAFSMKNRLPLESTIFLFCQNNLLVIMFGFSTGMTMLFALGVFVLKIPSYRLLCGFFWPENDAVMMFSLLGIFFTAMGRAVEIHVAFSIAPLICNTVEQLESTMDPDKLNHLQLQQMYINFVDAQKCFFDSYSPIWNGYAVGFALAVPIQFYAVLFHSSQSAALFLCNLSIFVYCLFPPFCVIFPPAWCYASYDRMLERISKHCCQQSEHKHGSDSGSLGYQLELNGTLKRHVTLIEKSALIQKLSALRPSLMFMDVHTVNFKFLAYYVETVVALMVLVEAVSR